ncbi:MAG: DNA-formamidopyrimidine glycosylase family protein [Acidimicrobiia bacterium]|nr:DNA-formamidopyrimidine glycosylase family protein [Acidimicrobiia bacterium]
MPEGDTLHQAATKLAVLEGQSIRKVAGSHRAVIAHGKRLVDHVVDSVRARGKHLIIGFDHGWSLRTHLQMTGSWHRYRPDERWRTSAGKARVVLESTDWVAVCFAAPTVQIAPDAEVEAALRHLGPDLIHDVIDWDRVVGRARAAEAATAADLLLNQTVMAGVGNVYKSETLYLERINPATPAAMLDDDTLQRLGQRARRLLIANKDRPNRSTTGRRGPGATLWVYGRGGKPCRRCRTPVEMDGLPAGERLTYWCPRCQPLPASLR